jgi:hypothetical protein
MQNAECGIGEAGAGRLKCAGWRLKVAGVGEGCICFAGGGLRGALGYPVSYRFRIVDICCLESTGHSSFEFRHLCRGHSDSVVMRG